MRVQRPLNSPSTYCTLYPRGLRGGTARKVQHFLLHFEQRMRFSTSTSFASQPHSLPKVLGCVMRSWPQDVHFNTKVY